MANLKDVIYISNEDYSTLVTTGTVIIDGDTLTYDENNVYVTPDKLASSTEDGLMSSTDKVKLDSLPTFGTATSKDFTTSVTSGSSDLVTSGAVYSAIDALPEPMIYKGTLGTGGTITDLPTASSSNEGFTYKVITDGTYASQAAKIGDLFISNGSAWTLVPSGDDAGEDTVRQINVNGTELLGTAISTGYVNFKNGSNVSISGSGHDVTISATDTTYSDATTSASGLMSASDKTKLNGIASGAEVNVQADWNVTDSSSDAFIKNKPSIPSAQVNSDWNATSGVAEILNKPTLATVATSGSYNDLTNKPTIDNNNQKVKAGSVTFGDNATVDIVAGDNVTVTGLASGTGAPKITISATDTDTGATSVETTGSGNVVNSASYDDSTRKLTLTKGITALTSHQSIKTLKTDNTTAQSTSSSEAIAGSGTINLHKVAKTGTYSDLIGTPTIPDSDSDLTNDRYVRYDTASQGLTDTQKSNARTNIGAGTSNLTIGTTATTAAAGNHTHTASISQSGSSGTSLAHNTWYTLTAGGSTVTFKTPSDNNTNYYATSDFTSSNGTKIATGHSGSSASTTYDLYAPNATATQAGLVTTGAQTFGGAKTFSSQIVSNNGITGSRTLLNTTTSYSLTNEIGLEVTSTSTQTQSGNSKVRYGNSGIMYYPGLSTGYSLSFPSKSGTLAVTDDLPDIIDLRS